jgi:hypothetical protein
MKKILGLGLSIACMVGCNVMAVQVKNNLAYGVAKREPSTGKVSKVVNICTVDVVGCNFGVITVDDLVIPREQLNVPIHAYGIQMNAGETKEVGPGEFRKEFGPIPVVYILAYYTIAPGVRYPTLFMSFVTKPVLSFPEDFTIVKQ